MVIDDELIQAGHCELLKLGSGLELTRSRDGNRFWEKNILKLGPCRSGEELLDLSNPFIFGPGS